MRGKWQIIGGSVVCVGLLVWLLASQPFVDGAKKGSGADSTLAVKRRVTTSAATPPLSGPLPGTQTVAGSTPLNASAMANMLETARDLRTIYNSLKDNKDPVARNIAYRAWTACFPTFVSPQGQPVSLDRILSAMPVSGTNNEARSSAYRGLHMRCEGFFQMHREEAVYTTRLQQDAWSKGEALSAGELAAKLLRDGEVDRAFEVGRAVLASRDAYAIASLQDFIHHSLVLQMDSQPQGGSERPDVRALAYPIVGCQMGLECGPDSLTALQLCANSGQCEGTVIDRYLQAMPNNADREMVMKESRRIREAIRSGNLQLPGLVPAPG